MSEENKTYEEMSIYELVEAMRKTSEELTKKLERRGGYDDER